MQDEHLDDIINEAANQHHPPYNDKAWEKMQAKLDAQLPQKDKKKRFLWFFFALLLVGGGAFYAGSLTKEEGSRKTEDGRQKTETGQQTVAQQKNDLSKEIVLPASQNAAQAAGANKTGQVITGPPTLSQQNKSLAQNAPDGNNLISAPSRNKVNSKTKTKANITPAVATGDDESTASENTVPVTENKLIDKKVEAVLSGAVVTIADKEENTTIKKEDQPTPEKAKEKIIITDEKPAVATTNKKKAKAGFLSGFGFTLSAGADRSFVSNNSPGKTTGTYGAGLSYSISKRVTVAAGFYVAKKIYSADSAYYKTPAGFFPTYYNINSIDADCKVYEIPISVTYNFVQGKKHNWFAGAGLSSYVMKKEVYNYDYKYTGSTRNYHSEYVVNNENKHLFSVLTLSGGYEYTMNKVVSLSAAPYMKLPLGGVGFGKVKLNSGGVLFTATIKPFAQKK